MIDLFDTVPARTCGTGVPPVVTHGVSIHTARDLVCSEPERRLDTILRVILAELSMQCDVDLPRDETGYDPYLPALMLSDGPWQRLRLSAAGVPTGAIRQNLDRAVARHFPFIDPDQLASRDTIRDLAYYIFQKAGA